MKKIIVYIDSNIYTAKYCEDMRTLFKVFETAGRIKLEKQKGIAYTFVCADEEIYHLIENLGYYDLFTTDDVE